MPPINKPAIQATIVYDSKNKSTHDECDAQCGIDWSSAEAIALAGQRIKERFGNKAKLDRLDLSEPGPDRRALELKQTIRNGNLSLPLLIIDGQVRISGQFDIRLLLDAIDAEIETEQQ